MDWNTPLGQTKIVDKRKNPTWSPPESVRKEHAERGDPLPKVVPSGPNNPLGNYAMRLNISPGAYLIHGTNNPIAVGMAVTHGCIRMYPEDIEALFPLVKVGTPVWLINQPVKVARVNGQVWLEVHPPVDAQGQSAEVDLEGFYALANAALGETPAAIHWDIRAVDPAGRVGPAADDRPRDRSGRGAASAGNAPAEPAQANRPGAPDRNHRPDNPAPGTSAREVPPPAQVAPLASSPPLTIVDWPV